MATKLPSRHRKILSVLNDLIRINIDRISAYEKAAHEDKNSDPDIRDVYYRLAIESRSFVNGLHAEIIRLGGAPVTESTITGQIYLNWLRGGDYFRGETASALLAGCLRGEVAVQKAYRHALEADEHLPSTIDQLVENQLWALERAYNLLYGFIEKL